MTSAVVLEVKQGDFPVYNILCALLKMLGYLDNY
jgi:hypothetical protein